MSDVRLLFQALSLEQYLSTVIAYSNEVLLCKSLGASVPYSSDVVL
jgi:hypothetical protein